MHLTPLKIWQNGTWHECILHQLRVRALLFISQDSVRVTVSETPVARHSHNLFLFAAPSYSFTFRLGMNVAVDRPPKMSQLAS